MILYGLKTSSTLLALLAAAKNSPPMTAVEVQVQRKSWVRGMCTPCEHGVMDFEQCPDCRNLTDDKETSK
jgi:hypothetical protein